MNEKKLMKMRKSNMKLYPIYEMIGLDLIFYYGIKVLFLTQIKGLSAAQVVLGDAFFALFSVVLQMPLVIFSEKVGHRKALIIANCINFISIIFILLCQNFTYLLISQCFSAIAYVLKNLTESTILNASIPKTSNKTEIFTNIDGKGYSKYCYIAALSTFASGFLYDINPYIPMIICLIFIAMSIVISYNFVEIKEKINKEEQMPNTFKENIRQVKSGFRFVFQSGRLKALLLMTGVIWGVISLFATYEVTLLEYINVSAVSIGVILAILQVISGLAAKQTNLFHRYLRNKALAVLAYGCTLGAIVAGMIVILDIPFVITLIIVLSTYVIRAVGKGIYQIIKKRYMGSFAHPNVLAQIYSADSISNNLMRMLIGFIGSAILSIMSPDKAMVLIGIIFTIVTFFILIYMKPRIGLKPEEYKKKDIEYKAVR